MNEEIVAYLRNYLIDRDFDINLIYISIRPIRETYILNIGPVNGDPTSIIDALILLQDALISLAENQGVINLDNAFPQFYVRNGLTIDQNIVNGAGYARRGNINDNWLNYYMDSWNIYNNLPIGWATSGNQLEIGTTNYPTLMIRGIIPIAEDYVFEEAAPLPLDLQLINNPFDDNGNIQIINNAQNIGDDEGELDIQEVNNDDVPGEEIEIDPDQIPILRRSLRERRRPAWWADYVI